MEQKLISSPLTLTTEVGQGVSQGIMDVEWTWRGTLGQMCACVPEVYTVKK